jgi:hypothetical protein
MKLARAALARDERAAREADIPALTAEVESASLVLTTPASIGRSFDHVELPVLADGAGGALPTANESSWTLSGPSPLATLGLILSSRSKCE